MVCLGDKYRISSAIGWVFFYALSNDIHPEVITKKIEKSSFVHQLEQGKTREVASLTGEELFERIFGKEYSTDVDLDMNNAYWCGWAYTQLFIELQKPFSYLFLIFPLSKMIDAYSTYHEMDITQLFEYFSRLVAESTLMKRLLAKAGLKAVDLARRTEVSVNTINYYKKSDKNFYSANFQNAYKLAEVLDVAPSIFLEQTFGNEQGSFEYAVQYL